jgi:hypothetical protein
VPRSFCESGSWTSFSRCSTISGFTMGKPSSGSSCFFLSASCMCMRARARVPVCICCACAPVRVHTHRHTHARFAWCVCGRPRWHAASSHGEYLGWFVLVKPSAALRCNDALDHKLWAHPVGLGKNSPRYAARGRVLCHSGRVCRGAISLKFSCTKTCSCGHPVPKG